FEVIEKIGPDVKCLCTDPGLLLPRANLTFYRDGSLVRDVMLCFQQFHRSDVSVIAKIESIDSLKNLEEIIQASDGVMVARGDLGAQILWNSPFAQQKIDKAMQGTKQTCHCGLSAA
ncbi:unnamed protein product, partial [Thlaspi arvense]